MLSSGFRKAFSVFLSLLLTLQSPAIVLAQSDGGADQGGFLEEEPAPYDPTQGADGGEIFETIIKQKQGGRSPANARAVRERNEKEAEESRKKQELSEHPYGKLLDQKQFSPAERLPRHSATFSTEKISVPNFAFERKGKGFLVEKPQGEAIAEVVRGEAVLQLVIPYAETQTQKIEGELLERGFLVTVQVLQKKPAQFLIRNTGNRSTTELLKAITWLSLPRDYVEPNYVYHSNSIPDDSLYGSNQWPLQSAPTNDGFGNTGSDHIDAPDGWDITTGTAQTIVAVVDTGVMLNHPDLANRLWDGSGGCVDINDIAISGGCPHSGWDFFDFDNNPSDESGHGTRVSGIVAAQGNNSQGISGVSWNTRLMALKAGTAGTSRTITSPGVSNSILFAVKNGAKIINASFNAPTASIAVSDAILEARDNGVLVVVSAGNFTSGSSPDLDQSGNNSFPCETALDNIICVASTNIQGTLDFIGLNASSNYGATNVDVAAPGSRIQTTNFVPTDIYKTTFTAGDGSNINSTGDLTEFAASAGSSWAIGSSGSNNVLYTHGSSSASYANSEDGYITLNRTIDLSGYQAGTLLVEMDCPGTFDNSYDVSGYPNDGIGIQVSSDGGQNFVEPISLNKEQIDGLGGFLSSTFTGLPVITTGLSDSDFTSDFTFRLHFFSNANTTGTGCLIDNVTLRVVDPLSATYSNSSGTSLAAPFVSGLASLVWDFKPSLSYQEVITAITNNGDLLPALAGKTSSGRRINVYKTLASLANPAVTNLKGFQTQGGAEFSSGSVISNNAPYFSWTAPVGQGNVSGYSVAMDGIPDSSIDATNTNYQSIALASGAHIFRVAGVNDVGALGTVQTISFTYTPPDTVNPVAVITAPTKSLNATITDTTVRVTDNVGIDRAGVTVHPTSTAGTSAPNCTQTSPTEVNCTIQITSSGNLVIAAADGAGNSSNATESGYVIDTVAPVISEVTAVSTPTNDSTPSYTFSSSEVGAITYGGACASATTAATVGNNSIIFNTLGEGAYNTCTIRVQDAVGNLSNVLTVSAFTVDTTAPVLSEVTAVPTPTNDSTPSYTFTSSEAGTIGYSGDCSSTITSASSGNNAIVFGTLTGGSHSNCTLAVTDSAGNQSSALNVTPFIIDTVAAGISITAPTKSRNAAITDTTIRVTDANGVRTAAVMVAAATTAGTSGFACVQTNATTVDCSITITSNGSLAIDATDNAGNLSTATETGYLIDTVEPVISEVTAVSTPTNDSTPSYTFSSSEVGTIVYGGACVSATTVAAVGNNTVTFNALGDGAYGTCTIRITDGVGNLSNVLTVSAFTVDTTAPTPVMNSSAAPGPTNTSSIPMTIDFGEVVTGFDGGDLSITNGNLANFVNVDGRNYSATITPGVNGNVVIGIANGAGEDLAGNDSLAATPVTVLYDGSAATVTFSAPTKLLNSTIGDTTFRIIDAVSVSRAGVTLAPGTTAGTANLDCTQTNATTVDCTIDITSSGDLVIAVVDNAGNSVTVREDGYVIELVPPTITISAPTKLRNGTINDTSIRVVDNIGILAANVTLSSGATTGTANLNCTQTSSTQVDCTIDITSSGDLIITAVDSAGNSGTATETNYLIDTVAPVISEVTAVSTPTNDSTPNYTFSSSEVGAITYSGDCASTTTNAVSGNNTVTFLALGNGQHNNCTVTVADSVGNVSNPLSVTAFTIDTVVPTPVITSSASPGPTNSSPIPISIAFGEVMNGFTSSDISVTSGAVNNFINLDGQNYTAEILPALNGAVTINIAAGVAQDTAGNANLSATPFVVVFDNVPPSFTFTAPTKILNTTITDTTIRMTDNVGIMAANVSLHASTTAGASNLNCTQTSSTQVDCTVDITSSGDLIVVAVDSAGNSGTAREDGYVIEATAPAVTITAPTKSSNTAITDTTILVTDANGVQATAVAVAPSTTAGAANLSCVQTSPNEVNCSIQITSSGNLVINATDNAGNLSTATESGYVIDTVAPVVSEVTAVSTPTNDSTPNYTFSSTEAGTITYGGACTSVTTSATAGNNTITFSTLSDGAYSTCTIRVQDTVGNLSNVLNVLAFTVDLTAPTLSEVTAVVTPGNDTTPNYSFSSTETGTITYGGDCSSASTSAVVGNQTVTFNALLDGAHSNCTVVVTDTVGNVSNPLAVSAFVIDTSAPTPVMNSSAAPGPTNTTSFPVTIDFGEVVTGFDGGDLSITNGNLASFVNVDGRNYSATITPGVNGNVVIGIANGAGEDLAGNDSASALPVMILYDALAPIITINAPTKSGNTIITDTTLHITDVNGVQRSNVSIDSSTTAGTSGPNCLQTNSTTVDCTIDITSSGDLIITAVDSAGNSGIAREDGYLIDTVAPIISEVTTVPTPTNDSTPSYTFSSSEVGTITYGGPCASATTAATVGNNSIIFNTLGEGAYITCTIRITDGLGNGGNVLNVSPFTVDLTAPTLSSVSIASGNSAPVWARTGDLITLQFTASEALLNDPVVTILGRPAIVTRTGLAATATQTVQASDSQGQAAFAITFTDLAGNPGLPVSQTTDASTVTIDTIAPSAPTGVSLGNGRYINAADQLNTSLVVQVTEPGILRYIIADANLTSQLNGSAVVTGPGQQTLSNIDLTQAAPTLPDGFIRTTVTLTDSAGNSSPAVSTADILDTILQPLTNVSLNQSSLVNRFNQGESALYFTASESGTVSYRIGGGGVAPVQGSMPAQVGSDKIIGIDISGFPDGRLDLEVTFTDLAGNSDVYRFSLQKDTVINAPQNVSLGDLAPSSADPWNVISTWNQTNINPLFSIQETGHANFTLRNPSVSGASIHQGITVSLPGNITVPTLDATRLPDGTLEYLVTFTDSAGNESRSATFTVLKDSRAVVPANISVNGGAPISNPALARGAPVTFTLEEPMALWTIVRDQSQREVTTSLIYRDPSFVGRRIMHTLPDVSSLQNGPLEVILRFTDLNANRAPEYRTIIQKNL